MISLALIFVLACCSSINACNPEGLKEGMVFCIPFRESSATKGVRRA
jgi:hypothetical protein